MGIVGTFLILLVLSVIMNWPAKTKEEKSQDKGFFG